MCSGWVTPQVQPSTNCGQGSLFLQKNTIQWPNSQFYSWLKTTQDEQQFRSFYVEISLDKIRSSIKQILILHKHMTVEKICHTNIIFNIVQIKLEFNFASSRMHKLEIYQLLLFASCNIAQNLVLYWPQTTLVVSLAWLTV